MCEWSVVPVDYVRFVRIEWLEAVIDKPRIICWCGPSSRSVDGIPDIEVRKLVVGSS